jgi:hypothetical protein
MFDYLDLPQLKYWPDASILQAGDMFTVTKQFLHSPFGKIFYVEVEVRARQVGCRVWVMQHPDKIDTYVLELERKSRPQQDKNSSNSHRR